METQFLNARRSDQSGTNMPEISVFKTPALPAWQTYFEFVDPSDLHHDTRPFKDKKKTSSQTDGTNCLECLLRDRVNKVLEKLVRDAGSIKGKLLESDISNLKNQLEAVIKIKEALNDSEKSYDEALKFKTNLKDIETAGQLKGYYEIAHSGIDPDQVSWRDDTQSQR